MLYLKMKDIKTDHKLLEIKTKLEDVINEKNDRQKILEELILLLKVYKKILIKFIMLVMKNFI